MLILPFTQGCDPKLFYSVDLDEEAIITQNGMIVGQPKEVGFHFKMPFLQEVHLVKVHRVRTIAFDLPESTEIRTKLFWHVVDSSAYFQPSQNGDNEKLIEQISISKMRPLVQGLSKDTILRIAASQKLDPYYSNPETEMVLDELRPHLIEFGIKIRLIFRVNDAQPIT